MEHDYLVPEKILQCVNPAHSDAALQLLVKD